jgi:hypothetical protein
MLIEHSGGLATTCTPKRRAAQAAGTLIVVGLCAVVLGARPAPAPAPAPNEESVVESRAGETATAAEGAGAPPVEVAPAPVAARAQQPPAVPRQQHAAQQAQEQDPGYESTLALVDRTLTLRGELELMEADVVEYRRLSQLGTVDEASLRRSELNVRSLHRRLQAVEILVQTEIQATQLELAELEQLLETGLVGTSARVRQVRLNAKLKVLRSAL